MISPVMSRVSAGEAIAVVMLVGVAMPTLALAQAYTLECAAITWGGDTVEQGQIGVVGQAVAGTASNSEFTLEAGIVPCLGAELTGGVIPTVSEWGWGIMALLILTAGTLLFRNRSSLQFTVPGGGSGPCA